MYDWFLASRLPTIPVLRAAAIAAAGGALMYSGAMGLGGAAVVFAIFDLWPPTGNRWAAHAMNWLFPAFAVVFCVLRGVARDWWGLSFGAVFVGLAVTNATLLEPSPKRTRAFRMLWTALGLVAILAVWRFFADGWTARR